MEKDSKNADTFKAGFELRRKLEARWGKIFSAQVGHHILQAAPTARVFRLIQGKRGDWQADIWYRNAEGWETRAVLMTGFTDNFTAIYAARDLYKLVREQKPDCDLMLPKGFKTDAFLGR